jgi:hypothetical protein
MFEAAIAVQQKPRAKSGCDHVAPRTEKQRDNNEDY